MKSLNKKRLVIVGLFFLLLCCVGWQATVVQQSPLSTLASGQPIKWSNGTGLSSSAAGWVLAGNGTQGDSSGTYWANVIQGTTNIQIGATGGCFLQWGGSSFDSGISRTAAGTWGFGNGTCGDISGGASFKTMIIGATAFASLGTPANGTFLYCSDCTIANPCASGGTGAFAKRLNGVWVCN